MPGWRCIGAVGWHIGDVVASYRGAVEHPNCITHRHCTDTNMVPDGINLLTATDTGQEDDL
jgi:hypothetical protein